MIKYKLNKVVPIKSTCDCCLEENIDAIECPVNNKCQYSMCKKCINNLKKTTKTNKCPNCRETMFTMSPEIKIDIVEDIPETRLEQHAIQFFWCDTLYRFCICKTRTNTIYNRCFNCLENVVEYISNKTVCLPALFLLIILFRIYFGFKFIRKRLYLDYTEDRYFLCKKKNILTKILSNLISLIIYVTIIWGLISICLLIARSFFKKCMFSSDVLCFLIEFFIGFAVLFCGSIALFLLCCGIGLIICECIGEFENDDY